VELLAPKRLLLRPRQGDFLPREARPPCVNCLRDGLLDGLPHKGRRHSPNSPASSATAS